jgi:hypothetical protein
MDLAGVMALAAIGTFKMGDKGHALASGGELKNKPPTHNHVQVWLSLLTGESVNETTMA